MCNALLSAAPVRVSEPKPVQPRNLMPSGSIPDHIQREIDSESAGKLKMLRELIQAEESTARRLLEENGWNVARCVETYFSGAAGAIASSPAASPAERKSAPVGPSTAIPVSPEPQLPSQRRAASPRRSAPPPLRRPLDRKESMGGRDPISSSSMTASSSTQRPVQKRAESSRLRPRPKSVSVDFDLTVLQANDSDAGDSGSLSPLSPPRAIGSKRGRPPDDTQPLPPHRGKRAREGLDPAPTGPVSSAGPSARAQEKIEKIRQKRASAQARKVKAQARKEEARRKREAEKQERSRARAAISMKRQLAKGDLWYREVRVCLDADIVPAHRSQIERDLANYKSNGQLRPVESHTARHQTPCTLYFDKITDEKHALNAPVELASRCCDVPVGKWCRHTDCCMLVLTASQFLRLQASGELDRRMDSAARELCPAGETPVPRVTVLVVSLLTFLSTTKNKDPAWLQDYQAVQTYLASINIISGGRRRVALVPACEVLGDFVRRFAQATTYRDHAHEVTNISLAAPKNVVKGERKTLTLMWINYLSRIDRMSRETAELIVAEYPTFRSLADAYDRAPSDAAAKALLQHLKHPEGVRRLGPVLSEEVWRCLTESNPDALMHSAEQERAKRRRKRQGC